MNGIDKQIWRTDYCAHSSSTVVLHSLSVSLMGKNKNGEVIFLHSYVDTNVQLWKTATNEVDVTAPAIVPWLTPLLLLLATPTTASVLNENDG